MTTKIQEQTNRKNITAKPTANMPSTVNIDLSQLLLKYGRKYGTSGYSITNSLTKAAKSSKR
jgi:hypothetical protein